METLCFCHLRWDFVYQRPQHLMVRFGGTGHVHYWEEPIFETVEAPALKCSAKTAGVTVLTPVLSHGLSQSEVVAAQRTLLDRYCEQQQLRGFISWYYTPMALEFSNHLHPLLTVYDCMDELSAFQGAPPELIGQEQILFAKADAVFAGGASLFAAKRTQHENVHLFPSSIDLQHFLRARQPLEEPADQAAIPGPRIGFFGVLDERLDRELLGELARARPEWHFILVGPVVKIREEELPRAQNLHYLGPRSYSDLPAYLSGWNVAILPFAQNASTRFISPTKTPEYLAGGKPVVSTPIQDVVSPYGEQGFVSIAANAEEFVEAIQKALQRPRDGWREQVDEFLALNSWDKTFESMWKEIQRLTPHGPVSSATDAVEN